MNYKKAAAGVICALMMCGMGAQTSAETANVEQSEAESSAKGKKVRILCHYDPTNNGKSYAAKQYKKKYGANVQWVKTEWDTRFNDLSTYVLSGKGIDLFVMDDAVLPKSIVNNMVQPVGQYVKVSESTFSKFGTAMNSYKFDGKYYALVTNVNAANVVYYNKKTIKKNGLEDPYTLWKDGKWNWDTFKSELEAFVDPEEGRYGLDGYYFEQALGYSAGKSAVSSNKGKLVSNLRSKNLAKAMRFGESLYNDGLIMDKADFEWQQQPQFLGEGKELFYIGGTWLIESAPSDWSFNIKPADLGVVPVPSPKGYNNYMYASAEGYVLLEDSDNPEGAVKFAELQAQGNLNKSNIAAVQKTQKNKYKWSNTTIKTIREINDTAKKYPVFEFAAGVSSDVASITINGGDEIGVRGPFHGESWSDYVNDAGDVVEILVNEANDYINE